MWFRQFIGVTAFLLLGIVFVLGQVVMWVVVMPAVAVFPRSRARILQRHVRIMRELILSVLRAAGARFEINVTIPSRGGTLLVMNHQSLVDVPVAFRCVPDTYPRMVARARYGRGIPVVSDMLRRYGHIMVDPGRTGRAELQALMEAAHSMEQPILIFPEGHRSRDGEILPWKRAGLSSFLSARAWVVYVLVVDGLWESGRISDFIRTISTVRCRAEAVGPFEYDGRGQERHDEFIDRLYEAMCAKLAEMRRRTRPVPMRERDAAGSVTAP
jgi:1-acyl-sn-glycerol-3-phosphate acyltransferase